MLYSLKLLSPVAFIEVLLFVEFSIFVVDNDTGVSVNSFRGGYSSVISL